MSNTFFQGGWKFSRGGEAPWLPACPWHRQRQTKQVTTPQTRRPHRDTSWHPSLQRSHLWSANHRLQKVCICWRKYAYPDDNYACWWRLAGSGRGAELGYGNRRWIHPDLETKHSTTKTVSAVFHLNNKEAKRELKVTLNNKTLPFCSGPKYLGVTLHRSLTYRRHRESLRIKLISRVALVRRLTGSRNCWVLLETTDLLNEAHVECWHKLQFYNFLTRCPKF